MLNKPMNNILFNNCPAQYLIKCVFALSLYNILALDKWYLQKQRSYSYSKDILTFYQ